MQGSTLEQLQQQLRSANAETRRQAAEQLGQVKDGRAVEALIAALTGGERDWSVLYAVAAALEDIADPWAVPALVEALWHHQDEFVRALAAGTLGKIGDTRAVEPLARALQEGGGVEGMMVRGAAAWALGEIGGAQAVEALIAHLEWGDKFEVLCTVAEALGKIGGDQAIESLGRVLNDNRTEYVVQQAAARSLGEIQDERAVEQLVEALKGTGRNVRRTVAEVLESLGWRPTNDRQRVLRAIAFEQWQEVASLGVVAVEPLIGLLQDEKRDLWKARAWSLANVADPWAVEPLVRTLGHVKDVVRSAAGALGKIADPRAVEPLVEVLKEAMSVAQQIAATALGKIGDLGAVESVLEALFDWEVEWAAQWRTRIEVPTIPLGGSGDDEEDEGGRSATGIPLLEDIGDARAVLQLVRALDDAEGVVSSVAWALGNIGDPRAIEALIAALARNEPWEALQGAVAEARWNSAVAREGAEAREDYVQVRGTVAEALGRIGDARAVEPLTSALQDKDWRVRQAALEALTVLGQKVPQPDHYDTCPTCAAEVVRPGDRFCLNCGTPVGVVGEQTKQPEERKTL